MPGKLLWVGVGLKVILLFILAVNSIFVMDEMHFLGRSHDLFNGLYETIWPKKAVGYSIVYQVAHLIGWDAPSTLVTGRMVATLMTCVSLGLVYALGIALGNTQFRALAIVFFVLCFTTFMERSFRVRAEPIGLVFGLASLLAVVRGNANNAKHVFTAGLLCGIAFTVHQKAVYYNLALGIALVGEAWLRQAFWEGMRRGILLVAGWSSVIIAYCLIFGGTDFLAVLKILFLGPKSTVLEATSYYPPSSWLRFIEQTLARNSIFYLLCLAGIVLSVFKIREMDAPKRIGLIFTIVIVGLISNHNQPWPYIYVMAIPFLALWALVPLDILSDHPPVRQSVLAVLASFVALSFVTNVLYLRNDNIDQLVLVKRMESLLTEEDTYLDFVDMLSNRYQERRTWLDIVLIGKIKKAGEASPHLKAIYESSPKIVVENYRSKALEEELKPFLENRYLRIYPNILIAGRAILSGEELIFDAPITGSFKLYSETGAALEDALLVDGELRFSPFQLQRGSHILKLQDGSEARYILPNGLPKGLTLPAPKSVDVFVNVYS